MAKETAKSASQTASAKLTSGVKAATIPAGGTVHESFESKVTSALAQQITEAEQQPPMFSVAERRLQHGDIAMLKSASDFDLVGLPEPMAIYWGTTESAYDLINVYGWVIVHAKYLPVKAAMLGLAESPEGYVTRGTNGSEMLFMMPQTLRDKILRAAANKRQIHRLSARKWKEALGEAAARDANDPSLTPEQRERASRAASAAESEKRAKFSFTEFRESHSGQPLEGN